MNTTLERAWTILRPAILLFLIVGVMDILLIGCLVFLDTVQYRTEIRGLSDSLNTKLKTPSLPDSRYEWLARDPGLPQNVIDYKRLHIDINPSQVIASYDVYLPKDHPVFLRAEKDAETERAEALVNEVLGAVSVSNRPLKFDKVETAIAETDEQAHLLVTAAPHNPTSNTYAIKVNAKQLGLSLNIASKEVIVHTNNVNVRSDSYSLPVSKTAEETRYVLPATSDELSLMVEVTNQPQSTRAGTRDTLATMLQRERYVPGLGQLIKGLFEALPFIIFLVWCNRNAANIANAHTQQRVIGTYLIIHFSYFFCYAMIYLVEDWSSPFAWALSRFERWTLPVFAATDYSRRSYVLLPMMILFIYVWPAFARRGTEGEQPKAFSLLRKARQILAIVITLALLSFVVWLVIDKLQTMRTDFGLLTVGEFYLLYVAVLVLAVNVLIMLLSRTISLRDRLGFALNSFLLLVLVTLVYLFWLFADSSGHRYLRLASGCLSLLLFCLNALGIAWAFAVLSYRGISERSLISDFKTWRAEQRALLIALLLAVALSTREWTWPMVFWPLWSLAWQLKELFFLVLVWFLAHFLREVAAEHSSLKLPPLAREAGILSALVLFYSPVTIWNYIPISFITGFFLLKFWLLPADKFDRGLFSDLKPQLKRLIERVIAFNDAERSLKTLKGELLTKLSKGDLEPQQYSDKLAAQAEALEARRNDLMVRNRFAKDYVLAVGPGDSAWDNGWRTARYSLLFCIPWFILYYRDIIRAPATSESYMILDLISNSVYFVLAWVSYGFILGYFYPQIRGNNGIQKALAMFLTIVVPEFVWTALAHPVDAANWTSFGFWTLQIFVHTMLLGMIAGDLFIMRAHGFKWTHLLDFYRLTSLSVWASSVVLAIAAAAGTLITSGATEILTSAFKYVGVIPPDVQLPKR